MYNTEFTTKSWIWLKVRDGFKILDFMQLSGTVKALGKHVAALMKPQSARINQQIHSAQSFPLNIY